ncbi:hypothetical protein [Agrobacterium tumefaciens]|uniref:hypothetical protein n=1 Tax=Agrobacterium tumefaciens TaxID=358 RepID=UPI0021CEC8BE|nr:hypothetical protein [Agrobacterium tumefaciens]
MTPVKVLERIAFEWSQRPEADCCCRYREDNSRRQFNFGIIEHDADRNASDDKPLQSFCCRLPEATWVRNVAVLGWSMSGTHTDVKRPATGGIPINEKYSLAQT